MKSFLKFVLASMVGVFIASSILILIGVGMLGAALSRSEKPVEVKENSILSLKLNYGIMDRSPNNPFGNIDFRNFELKPQLGLNDILGYINKAKHDDHIKGIFLDLTVFPSGMATAEEIRDALDDFRSSGKFVIAHADYYTFKTYYLASVADKVFLTPTGMVEFNGLSAEVMYFKKAMEKLGVKAEVFRSGKYKSAVEPLMQDEMSRENREQISGFLNGIWDHNLEKIAGNRSTSVDKLDYLADNMVIRNTQAGYDENLVDSLVYADQVMDYLKSLLHVSATDNLEMVQMNRYTKTQKPRKGKGLAKDKLAVVYAEGDIMLGEADESSIGADRLAKAIRQARQDSAVKAIVLRVNSPGGSALASEIILREVDLARKAKPVIASMGNLAASGGYYISCMADTIVCNTTTLTGSIGAFGALLNVQEMMNDKLGITVEVVKTNDHADIFSPFRQLESAERRVIQGVVDTIYSTFLDRVVAGRNLPKDEVDRLGQGRIWTGTDARKHKLVDVTGGLDKAIEIAVYKANMDQYRTIELPVQKDPLEQMLTQLGQEVRMFFMKDELGVYYKHLKTLKNLSQQEGIMARLPFGIEVK
jgi:protease IV